nr:uncharacterized protein LOC107450437 [Parasteatoda tepidariorum]
MPSLIYRGKYDNPPHKERSAYILPPIKYPDGNTYLKIGYYGSDMEVEKLDDIKQWFLSEGDKESIDLGVKLLFERIPGLKSEEVTSSTCVNCYTPSGLPYIDRITPTLTVAIAGNGKGAKFSDEVGRLAAKLCIDGLWDSRVSQSRFKAEFSDD